MRRRSLKVRTAAVPSTATSTVPGLDGVRRGDPHYERSLNSIDERETHTTDQRLRRTQPDRQGDRAVTDATRCRTGKRHRVPLLTTAYLLAGEYEHAERVIAAGLALAENDLPCLRRAAQSSRVRALRRGPDDLETGFRPRPRSAALTSLQPRLPPSETRPSRGGRGEWEAIIAWLLERGYTIEAEWPSASSTAFDD